jgi:hypothetical protein
MAVSPGSAPCRLVSHFVLFAYCVAWFDVKMSVGPFHRNSSIIVVTQQLERSNTEAGPVVMEEHRFELSKWGNSARCRSAYLEG